MGGFQAINLTIIRVMRTKRKKIKHRSKSRRKSSKRKSSYVILLIVIIFIFLFIQGDQGFLQYIKLQQEKKRLLKHIEELKKVIRKKLHKFKNRGCHFCKIQCEGSFLFLIWNCKE